MDVKKPPITGVIIGMDPHKRSATIEVLDQRERLLGAGRFSTDTAGYRLPADADRRAGVQGPDVGGRGRERHR